MTCFSEVQYSIYVDGEMPRAEGQLLEGHMTQCRACRQVVEALRREGATVAAALQQPLQAPAWSLVRRPAAVAAIRNLSATVGLWLLVRWLSVMAPPGFAWIYPRGIFTLLLSEALRSAHFWDRAATALWWAAAIGAIGILVSKRWQSYIASACLLLAMCSIPAHGMTRRSDRDVVLVRAAETLNDSLIATGDTVRIDGTVNGDLIAFARRVEISGIVKGSLISFSQTVDVRGAVEGNVYSAGQTLDFSGSIGRNVYAMAESVNFSPLSRVGLEVLAAGDALTARGAVGRDVAFFGGEMSIDEQAKVSGKVSAHVSDKRHVKIAGGAVSGAVEIEERQPRLLDPTFYSGELLALCGALLIAWVSWRLTPRFMDACVRSAGAWWRNLAIGAVAAVSLPMVAVMAALTRVGLPLAAITLGIYLAALYLAKIVIGAYLGKALLPGRSLAGQLIVGLSLIWVAVELPFSIGMGIRIAVFVSGLGAFAWELGNRMRRYT